MRPVVVLRPEPGASETLARAQALGLEATSVPLFAVEPLDWPPPDPVQFDGLLLTSANALRHAGPALQQYRTLPVHAVGGATAAAARDAGLTVLTTGPSDVNALLASVEPPGRLLHLSGADRSEPQSTDHSITAVPVYRSVTIRSPSGLQAIAGAVALVHSPRAGQRLSELVEQRGSTVIAAISLAAANSCGNGWAKVSAADSPNDHALLSLAQRLCEQSPP